MIQQEVTRAEPMALPTLRKYQEDYIARVMSYTGGNRSKAARILGVSRNTLLYRPRAKKTR